MGLADLLNLLPNLHEKLDQKAPSKRSLADTAQTGTNWNFRAFLTCFSHLICLVARVIRITQAKD